MIAVIPRAQIKLVWVLNAFATRLSRLNVRICENGALGQHMGVGCWRARTRCKNIPVGMGYIERISERGAGWIIDGLRARGSCEVRKGRSEVLEQLLVRLLRIGPTESGQLRYQSFAATCARRAHHSTLPRRRRGEKTYRLRNIAGKLEAEALEVVKHRESSKVGRWGGSKVT